MFRNKLPQTIRTVASATSRNTIAPSRAISAARIFRELHRQAQDTNIESSDDWGCAAHREAQQLRGCSTGVKRSPAATQVYTPAPAPAPHSKVGEMTIEERKVVALEAIAEAARLWVKLNNPNKESKTDERSGSR
ncbi:uncharacterized protein FOBCDRAFT_251695 [Fusarium oxysporum Fo47]|uniref:Uncharacterized protein n=1 Tax=Fusarium oxysporum Fo47 TaxID=660027 RepID=W9J808_FUSOX|nr:uncharacterized protein FOBCDRAFT_251695 [Fusarium oxysporum Fo47]EWZ28001.1 hypothetical protein FOZG_18278 [Fusarium oxysporum Fo47]QKD56890.1 hypothetical protein FOBCDRAFT_251695 [Fusarium oxysporum Fo47]